MPTRLLLIALVIAHGSSIPYLGKPVTKAVFCAFGSIGIQPLTKPPGFESQFATAVVEIDSPQKIEHADVTEFVLIEPDGKTTPMKRVITIERFEERPKPTEGKFAFYLNTEKGSRTRAWDGTLPAGKIRLRVDMALVDDPGNPTEFRITVGGFTVEGPVDGSWLT
jgi:hypothetical protein